MSPSDSKIYTVHEPHDTMRWTLFRNLPWSGQSEGKPSPRLHGSLWPQLISCGEVGIELVTSLRGSLPMHLRGYPSPEGPEPSSAGWRSHVLPSCIHAWWKWFPIRSRLLRSGLLYSS
jgi:hypothetical protein